MVILLDDCGVFRKGAEFRCLDWALSAHAEVWPNGSRWRWEGRREHTVKVVGGIPVRDDGAIMYTTQSRYEWRK